jgi:ABC-type multidrug transport system ATPase subunit
MDVVKRYGARRVLCGASFEARSGELVAILGENGSGKSTLLRILAGAEDLDGGQVRRLARLGYCPQEHVLYPYLTIGEHLELFGYAYGLGAKVARARADELLERFALGDRRHQVVEQLSGGTRQKLNLAIALLHDPEVVLLDEPYAALDIASYRAFLAWADDAKHLGKCIVLVAHLVLESERFDTVLHLRDGRLHDQSC